MSGTEKLLWLLLFVLLVTAILWGGSMYTAHESRVQNCFDRGGTYMVVGKAWGCYKVESLDD